MSMPDLLANDSALSQHARFLKKHGLYSAACYFVNLNDSVERRAARACRYDLEHPDLPDYEDGQILAVPSSYRVEFTTAEGDDPNGYGFTVSPSGFFNMDEAAFEKLRPLCTCTLDKFVMDAVLSDARAMRTEIGLFRYAHGGVHHNVDIETVLRQGVGGYRKSVQERRSRAEDRREILFCDAMEDVVDGIEAFVGKLVRRLEETERTFGGDRDTLRRLIRALKKVPMGPAKGFYEALVSLHTVMLVTNAFESGTLDRILQPYYDADIRAGKIDPETAEKMIRALLEDMEQRNGHPGAYHVTLGGSAADGSPVYGPLTEMIVRATGGLRTPNVTVRVRPDMPDSLWDQILYNLGRGFGQPALVSEELYLKALTEEYGVPFEDAVRFGFAGCSETMISGMTMVDSTWATFDMEDVLENTIASSLLSSDSFEAFYGRYKEDCGAVLRELEGSTNLKQFARAVHYPEIVRTLFTRDCVENAASLTAGGCRYNYDNTDVIGSVNAANALYVIRYFYEGKLGGLTAGDLLDALRDDFEGHPRVARAVRDVPKLGNYEPELNALYAELTGFVFDEILKLRCWRGNAAQPGRYCPAIIPWTYWRYCGDRVGATPDGRRASEPEADSCGAMQGTDTEGPTSLMGSALSVPQEKCAGTCILNLRLAPENFKTEEGLKKVRALFETYFAEGGCQLQVNVVDPETLRAALREPEKHRDVIVRVGGFSDNFVLLDPQIQQAILRRTEYSV